MKMSVLIASVLVLAAILGTSAAQNNWVVPDDGEKEIIAGNQNPGNIESHLTSMGDPSAVAEERGEDEDGQVVVLDSIELTYCQEVEIGVGLGSDLFIKDVDPGEDDNNDPKGAWERV